MYGRIVVYVYGRIVVYVYRRIVVYVYEIVMACRGSYCAKSGCHTRDDYYEGRTLSMLGAKIARMNAMRTNDMLGTAVIARN